VPEFVKKELIIWIGRIQNKNAADEQYGGAGYEYPGWSNILRTGHLLHMMAFVGYTTKTQKVQNAANYLVRWWSDYSVDPGWRGGAGDVACYQATFSVMRGLTALGIDKISNVEWYGDFQQVLSAQQLVDGSWPQTQWDRTTERILSTTWALFTLQKGLPMPLFRYLAISSTNGGSVTGPGEGIFAHEHDQETVVDLVAVADECYEFVNWTGSVVADPQSPATTITLDTAKSVTANFARLRYSLTVECATGGRIATPGSGNFTYDCEKSVSLIAYALAGHKFVNWTGDIDTVADANAASTFITMQGNYSVKANFEEMPKYNLTVSSTVGGSVTTPGEGAYTYVDGTMVSLVAVSAVGYRFINWTGDVATVANPDARTTVITMNSNYSITANFEELEGEEPSEVLPGEGCFIATATYGTPMAEEIQILREFRDGYLLTNSLGQAFVDFYYRTSPPIAEFITEHPSLKPIVRVGLVPAVAFANIAVSTASAEKTAMVGLLVLVSAAVAIWAATRRHRGAKHY